MADSGTISFELVDSMVKITGEIRWAKSGNNAEFYAALTQAYSSADNQSKWRGNYLEKMRLGVDGTCTAWADAAGARAAGSGASGSGWRQNNDYAGAQTETLTAAAKSTAYALTVEITGNGGATGEYSVTIVFALPLYVNDNGTVKQAEKVYINDNGTIRECAVYVNDNGTIKEIG